MPALNFKVQFAPAVESGEKTQTIRKVSKRPIRAGDTLYLKAGMRTKHCRSLGTATYTTVTPIKIYPVMVQLGEQVLMRSSAQTIKLAKLDGFEDFDSFASFFQRQYGLPFTGVVIAWKLSR